MPNASALLCGNLLLWTAGAAAAPAAAPCTSAGPAASSFGAWESASEVFLHALCAAAAAAAATTVRSAAASAADAELF